MRFLLPLVCAAALACGEPPPATIGDCTPDVEQLPDADVRVLHEGPTPSGTPPLADGAYENVGIVFTTQEDWEAFLEERWFPFGQTEYAGSSYDELAAVDFGIEQVVVLFDYSSGGGGTALHGWSAVERDGGVHVEADFAGPAQRCGGASTQALSQDALVLAVPAGDLTWCHLDTGGCKRLF